MPCQTASGHFSPAEDAFSPRLLSSCHLISTSELMNGRPGPQVQPEETFADLQRRQTHPLVWSGDGAWASVPVSIRCQLAGCAASWPSPRPHRRRRPVGRPRRTRDISRMSGSFSQIRRQGPTEPSHIWSSHSKPNLGIRKGVTATAQRSRRPRRRPAGSAGLPTRTHDHR